MHRRQRLIKRGKSPPIVPGERDQIGVGHLFTPDDPGFNGLTIFKPANLFRYWGDGFPPPAIV